MATLDKVTYADGATVIYADNLNDIQDAILDLISEVNALSASIQAADAQQSN